MVVAVDLDDDGLDGGITLDQDAWRSELDVDLPSCKKIQKFKNSERDGGGSERTDL